MKQETPVEWLTNELKNQFGFVFSNNILEKALEMEKEHIIEAYIEGKTNGMDISHPLSLTKEISAEQYYNETYKK